MLRIGVFYDGSYFGLVSSYYAYHHPRMARLSIGGLHKFIREKIAQEEGVDTRYSQIVESHYFRGRYTANQSVEKGEDTLYRERLWEDILVREAVTTHYLPMQVNREKDRSFEKGIDVWLAVEALELAILKNLTHVVLIAADSDYIPLVRKLNSHSVKVAVLGWNFSFTDDHGEQRGTRASQLLMGEVSYPMRMDEIIDSKEERSEEEQALIGNMFVRKRENVQAEEARSQTPEPVSEDDKDESGWKEGTVVNLLDGFGFIKPTEGGDNLFFHHTALTNSEFSDLFKGMEVSFQEGIGQRGTVCATKVRTYY
ncbi:cold-shock domain-contain protein [Caballeronia peredens]|nr:cold-shock domain-contain protein [Caballeronia peredens]